MSGNTSDTDCELSPEEIAQMRAHRRAWVESIRPASGSTPRAIAKLALATGESAMFVVWRNGRGELCFSVEGDVSSGPSGPCMPSSPCAEICVASTTESSDGQPYRYLLSGVVPAEASLIRVTQAGGKSHVYPSIGALVPGAARRVLMLDLGAHDWRRVDAIRDGRVVASEAMPALFAAIQDCEAKVGPEPPTTFDEEESPAERRYNEAFDACLSATFPNGLPTLPTGFREAGVRVPYPVESP